MVRKVGHENRPSGDGMNKFQGEKLAGTNKTPVVLVYEIEGKEGEKIGKHKVDGKIRIRVADEIQPVWGNCVIRRKGSKAGRADSGPIFGIVSWPVIVVIKVFVVLSNNEYQTKVGYVKELPSNLSA